MRRVISIAIVGVLAACGSSGGSEKASYVDAAMKGYKDAPASTKDVMSESEARCLVEGMVDIIGVDNLKKNGIKPDDLNSNDSPFTKLGNDVSKEQATEVASLDHGRHVLQLHGRGDLADEGQLEPVQQARREAGSVPVRQDPR